MLLLPCRFHCYTLLACRHIAGFQFTTLSLFIWWHWFSMPPITFSLSSLDTISSWLASQLIILPSDYRFAAALLFDFDFFMLMPFRRRFDYFWYFFWMPLLLPWYCCRHYALMLIRRRRWYFHDFRLRFCHFFSPRHAIQRLSRCFTFFFDAFFDAMPPPLSHDIRHRFDSSLRCFAAMMLTFRLLLACSPCRVTCHSFRAYCHADADYVVADTFAFAAVCFRAMIFQYYAMPCLRCHYAIWW